MNKNTIFLRKKEENNTTIDIGGDVEEVTINMGSGRVTLDKLYGPLIFTDIQITIDIGSCEWVIWRRNGHDEFVEVARIPGQLPEDFPCIDCRESPAGDRDEHYCNTCLEALSTD